MSNASSEQSEKPRGFPARGAQVGWGPTAAVTVGILAFVGAQILVGLVLSSVVGVLGVKSGIAEAWFNSVAGQFVFVVGSDALVLLLVWMFLRHRRGGFRQLGFGRNPAWKDVGFALLGYVAYYMLLILAVSLVGMLTQVNLDQKQELGFDNLLGTKEKIMAFVSLVVLPPIVEETVFRGFIFTGLRRKFKFVWATIITSILFAGPHLLASSDGLLWIAGVDTLVLSFLLCYLREKTGALWAPMALHALKNSIAYFLLVFGVASL